MSSVPIGFPTSRNEASGPKTRLAGIFRMASRQAGFTLLEVLIATGITLSILYAVTGAQSSATKAFRFHEANAQAEQKLARVVSRIDEELRKASSGSLEVPGNPLPTAPTDGTVYNEISFRQVIYDTNAQQTAEDPNPFTFRLNGSSLEFVGPAATAVLAQGVTGFSVVWDGGLRQLAVTVQVTETLPDNGQIVRAKRQLVFLRNS